MRALSFARFFVLFFMSFCVSGPCPSFAQPPAPTAPQPLEILRITPDGQDVPDSRQIVIEFNRPVVPLGRMDRTTEEVGVTLDPPLACAWRWLNVASLACNLSAPSTLRPATRYEVRVGTVVAAQDGGKLKEPYIHSFVTQRPDVEWQNFQTWKGPGTPLIRIVFNQPVSKPSVAAHLFLSKTGDSRRLPLDVQPDQTNGDTPVWLPLPGEKSWLSFDRLLERRNDDRPTAIGGQEARRVWIVSPVDPLPLDSSFSLTIEPGLVSASGPEPGAGARTLVTFDTYPAFAFAGLQCTNNAGRALLLKPESPHSPAELCNPLAPVSVAFTAPVLRSRAQSSLDFEPDLGGKGAGDQAPWGNSVQDWSRLDQPHQRGTLYSIFLPVPLKAAQTYRLTLAPPPGGLSGWMRSLKTAPDDVGLVDEFNRPLPAPLTLDFSTDHRRPNFEIVHRSAVLEKSVDSEVPLYVNNLESATFSYRRVRAGDAAESLNATRTIPSVADIQFAIPFGVREMLGGKPGAIYGFVDTKPFVRDHEFPRRLFAQVTPWQVHLKLGHFSSLAWVTDLADGKPVSGVSLRLYTGSFPTMGGPTDVRASAVTNAEGLATLPGTDTVDPDGTLLRTWEDTDTRLFLRADKGEDMALLPVSNEFAIDLWSVASGEQIYADTRPLYRHIKAWGLTAQGIYRAGDTIQYKIYVRGQNDRTLIPPPRLHYTLSIRDPMGNTVATIPDLALSDFGAYAGTFAVPKTAPVGWYDFVLTVDPSKDGQASARAAQAENTTGRAAETEDGASSASELFTLSPLRVLVSDFTPAPFRVTTELSGERFQPGDPMTMDLRAALHSGGAYPDAAARLTARIEATPFKPRSAPARDFSFDSAKDGQDRIQIFQKEVRLDNSGQIAETLILPQQTIVHGSLSVEGAVQDDRGKSVASRATAAYTGVDRMVGVRSPQWVYETGKEAQLETLVVDAAGAPIADVPVKAVIEHETVSIAKVKGAGNAYLNETTVTWEEVARCEGSSAASPVPCAFTPAQGGTYRLTATIADMKGRPHTSVLTLWVTGSDYVQWNDQSETALPLVPEKTAYAVGDTARVLVKNPWPGAKALVTIERYGIIDRFVKTLEGGAPVLEIPIKPDYLPGAYLSVLLFSPRVETPPPEAGQVDLGKPSFRMGYIALPVSDPYKEMAVDVKVAQEVYRPGDTVRVSLHTAPRQALPAPAPIELAVAVVDEAVFDLIAKGRAAYDPYAGFNELEGLDLSNYSLLTRLVGRQKFEKKGANPGGDGGADLNLRSLFKFVSYWNPSLPVDANGNATVDFKAPDNLTGWRVLALAVTPGDRMGLGEGTFKVNRPTELRPVMPNQIREGESFRAGFSVMNRTDKARTIQVEIRASGDLKDGKPAALVKTVMLEPYKRENVFLPLEVGTLPLDRDTPQGSLSFTATAADETDSDAVTHTISVLKSRIFDVGALYGTTTGNTVRESVVFPPDIHTDVGDLTVTLSPSVLGNLEGAFRYLRDYPYPCWEQILTRGVMAARFKTLKPWLTEGFSWPNAESLPDQTLARAAEFQAPSGGMTYFIPQDEYADPYLSAYTALVFGWLKADGYAIPQDVETKLTDYLLTFLRKDVAPDFYQEGMTSTVRAVALAALAQNGRLPAEDLERYRAHMPRMDLFGKAHILMAALADNQDPALARETVDRILSAGNETAGKLVFNQTYDDGYARILASPLRDNCAVVGALTRYAATPEGKILIGDKAMRAVRAITQSRGNRDHWENTQENVFCLNALTDYARLNETEKPALSVTATLDSTPFGEAGFKAFTDAPVSLTRPIGLQDPGRAGTLTLDRSGTGRLYYAARLRTASKAPTLTALNAGMDLRREWSIRDGSGWKLLGDGVPVRRGDTVRVDLYLSLPAARNFLVVDDPVPSGLEPVNRDLATASGVDADEAAFESAGGAFWFKYSDWREYGFSRWSFYHRELRHDSARFYADYLPPGNYHLSYVAQAVAEGTFAALPARAEEMYDPDIYARSAASTLIVAPDGRTIQAPEDARRNAP